jgi:hypothetical protein
LAGQLDRQRGHYFVSTAGFGTPLELAAEERNPLAHSAQPLAGGPAVAGLERRSSTVAPYSDFEHVVCVTTRTWAADGPACFRLLVNASWTIL